MRFHYFQFRPLSVVCAVIMPGWWKSTAPPRHPLRNYGYQNKLILSPLTWWDPQFWLWRCCCSYSSSVGSSSPQFASTCPAHCETPWSGSTIYHKQLHEEGYLINCAWKSWVYTNLTCLSPAVMRKALLESKIIEVTGSECGSLILSVSKNMNHGHVMSCCVNLLKAVQMISWTELYLCILLLLSRRMQCFGPDHTDIYIMDCVIKTSSILFRKNLDRLPVQWQQQDRQEREQSDLAGCCPKDKSQSPAP